MRGQHIGARLDDEIRIDARLGGRMDLLHHFVGGDHFLATHVAAALRPYLVFEHQARDAGALERAHGVISVERIAVAGVAIGEQSQIRAAGYRARGGNIFFEPHQTDVRLAEARLAHSTPGNECGRVAELADEPGAESVEYAGENEDVGRFDQRTQALAGTCHSSLLGRRAVAVWQTRASLSLPILPARVSKRWTRSKTARRRWRAAASPLQQRSIAPLPTAR